MLCGMGKREMCCESGSVGGEGGRVGAIHSRSTLLSPSFTRLPAPHSFSTSCPTQRKPPKSNDTQPLGLTREVMAMRAEAEDQKEILRTLVLEGVVLQDYTLKISLQTRP